MGKIVYSTITVTACTPYHFLRSISGYQLPRRPLPQPPRQPPSWRQEPAPLVPWAWLSPHSLEWPLVRSWRLHGAPSLRCLVSRAYSGGEVVFCAAATRNLHYRRGSPCNNYLVRQPPPNLQKVFYASLAQPKCPPRTLPYQSYQHRRGCCNTAIECVYWAEPKATCRP
jgi:hypothetical protein